MATSKFVDEFAVAQAQFEAAKAKMEALKAKLIAIGEAEIEGKQFKVKVSTFEQTRLDMTTVRSFLSEEQLTAAGKQITVTTVRVKAKAKAVAA